MRNEKLGFRIQDSGFKIQEARIVTLKMKDKMPEIV
jgi:hypothetical protein